MAKLTIKDTEHPQLNGEYDMDMTYFTKNEHYLMKKHCDVVMADYAPGARVDLNVLTAWGLVALTRAGKQHLFPLFMETTDAQTDWDFDEAEVKEVETEDLAPTTGGSPESERSTATETSGAATNGASDASLAIPLPLTGSQP